MDGLRKRVGHEFEEYLPALPGAVFPLLCPVREFDWIPQWRCDMLYSQSGVAELGCVFATDYGDEFGREIWVVCIYEPNEKIGFVRTGKNRTTRYEVSLRQKGGGTVIVWHQEITALNPAADQLVADYSAERFKAMMAPLNRMLTHYLEKGEALDLEF